MNLVKAVRMVLSESCKLRSNERLVFLALARRADSKGVAWPGIDVIGRDTGLSRSTVLRCVDRLEVDALTLGLTVTRRSNGQSNVYRFTDQNQSQCDTVPNGRNQSQCDTSVRETPVSERHPTSVTVTLGPVSERHPKVPIEDTQKIPIGIAREARRPTARGLRRVPDSWQPDPKTRHLALREGKNFDKELAKFRDHEFAKARKDWHATWRNWLRSDYGKSPRGVTHADQDLDDELRERVRRRAAKEREARGT